MLFIYISLDGNVGTVRAQISISSGPQVFVVRGTYERTGSCTSTAYAATSVNVRIMM